MSLPFAKLSSSWKNQDADDTLEENEKEGVNILHHRNKQRWDKCTCHRCLRYRYQRGIRRLANEYGREPTQVEVGALWDRIQREAGVI